MDFRTGNHTDEERKNICIICKKWMTGLQGAVGEPPVRQRNDRIRSMNRRLLWMTILLTAVLLAECAQDTAAAGPESATAPESAAGQESATAPEAVDTAAAAAEIELDEDGFPVYDASEEMPLAEDAGFTQGERTDVGYRNDYFGIAFVFPEGWKYTESHPADVAAAGGDLAGYLKNGGIFQAFAASDEHAYRNTFVALERIRTIHTEMMTPESLMVKAAAHLEESMTAAGAELTDAEEGMEEFLGEERPVIRIEAKLGDVDIYETQVIILKGTYAANILAVSYGTDETAEILASYQADGAGRTEP